MNRTRFPCCSRCKLNYNIGDRNGFKVPMLLNCGHDICKACLNFQYKKDKLVICDVCNADCEIKSNEQLYETPIHYYLVGKVWFLMSNKQRDILRDICNLKMKNLISESPNKDKKNCQLCHKLANIFCLQCNDVYCKACSEKVHMDNPIMYNHDLEKLDNIHPDFNVESKCDLHLKLIEYFCITCKLQICSTCAINGHRLHDTQTLEEYSKNSIQCLNEYTLKGEILIRNLNRFRNDLNLKMQKHLDVHSKKKNNDSDNNKNKVMTFVSSLIGALQRVENNVLNMIEQSETSVVQSINNVIYHLSSSIDNLQSKLNQIDLMLNNRLYLCATISDFIVDIERTLNTTYYIAKKNKAETSIVFNTNIVDAIWQCVVPTVDISDAYILTNTPDLSSNYTVIGSTIKLENDAPAPIWPQSSHLDVSTSSEYSTKSSDSIKTQNVDLSYVKEITKNKVETVLITHVNSPSDFYLQLHDNTTTLKTVSDELNKFVRKKQSAVQCIEMNNVMYAVQLSTDQWCRGVVIHIYNENGYNLYTIHCVDYGFTETLTSDKIRKVPESVVPIPSLAYNCALYDLKPKTTTGWSNDAYQLFRDLITQDKTISFFMYPMETNGERIEVDVICNGIHPMSIRDAMLYLGYGTTENYMTIALREKLLKTITLPSDKILKEGEIYSIIISHLYSPSEFYFRTSEDDEFLTEIMKTLETMYKPTENDLNKSYLLYTPQIGMAVAARYSIDDTWYRAKIISLPESRMVTIYYIDYGNSETLPWDQLRVLDQDLIKTPPLAIKASLSDLYPALNGIECANWSDDATAAFFNLVKSYESIDDNLTAKVIFVDDDSHKVVLYNHTSRGEVCVNSKLITQGHGMRLDSESYSFVKENVRTTLKRKPKLIHVNSRNKPVICSTEDTLAFVKPWSIVEDVNHSWPETKANKNVPGVEMSVVKVISPDEITLKRVNYNSAKLIEQMNNVYNNKKLKKKNQKTQWQVNDLCAAYIKKFGNWYRGKILSIDTTNCTASISFYDLDQINHGIPVDSLYTLTPNLINAKCGIVHCCMDNLIPLGVSDSKWPKFSCDRLIEELKKYSVVYFSKTRKIDNLALGEIWVKEVKMPEALKPVRERWINMNTFMIEQGFAISNKQNAKVDEYLTSQSESEFNKTFESLNYDVTNNCWLPPMSITKSQLNVLVTYIDMDCHVYFQVFSSDSETPQLLKNISEELNSIFSGSQPEPMNIKWKEGQMVIVKYHLDDKWYRGTIIEVDENENYSVQFLDYGNIETCSREDLRSTLYMTDIPQLCLKGFFTSILPMTKDNRWKQDSLDFIHSLVVEQMCTVTVDLSLSSGSLYAISKITMGKPPQDVCQLLVTQGSAYFSYASKLVESIGVHTTEEGEDDQKAAKKESSEDGQSAVEKESSEDARFSRHGAVETRAGDDGKQRWNAVTLTVHAPRSRCSSAVSSAAEKDDDDDDMRSSTTAAAAADDEDEENDEETRSLAGAEESSGYSRFYLDSNEVVEGTLCRVNSPDRITMMIERIDGIDITESKQNMQTAMLNKCAELPVLDDIVPDMAIVIFHNFLWRRGIISKDGKHVRLVDFGSSIKLIKNNVKLCPAEFFKLPMFSIDCRLAKVTMRDDADARDVVEKMTRLLRGVKLKIAWVGESAEGDESIVDVDLYNSAGDVAYQPLIDSGLLIPK